MPADHSQAASSPQATILRITGQLLPARCIAIAAELALADLLTKGPQKADELADSCGIHGPSLFRMMRFLASIEIFQQNEDGRFSNTPQSEVLRKDVPGSIYSLVRQGWQDVVWDTYKMMPQSLQTGNPAFTLAHGKPFFDYLADNPECGAMFDTSMALMSGPENAMIAETYPFGDAKTVMDIGGGRGGLLAAVLTQHQSLTGILFDQPQVVANPEAIIEAGLEDRCDGVAGNFFEAIPASADVYMLKRILHDWSDEGALRILTCIRKALTAEERVAVIDAVIKPGNDADPNKYLDMGIMTLLQGRERTAEEFENLFTSAGLQLLRILPTPAPSTMSIIEGALA